MLRIAVIFLILLSSFAQGQERYVLLVSFDGFRHDYAENYHLTNFLEMAENGATSKMMVPSFPSKTFPNHYTLVTGLYPGHHGLVDNSFYDGSLDIRYITSNRKVVENPAFYGGWPLWQWVQEHDLKSASYFWVGSEAPIHGRYPDIWKKYQHNFPNENRIDSVFKWFELTPQDRPNFVSLYFALVDDGGHAYGPNDPRTEEVLKEADALLGAIRNKIKAAELPINLVVVSDHGMTEFRPSESTFIDLTSFIELPKDALKISNSGTHLHIYANDVVFGTKFYQQLKSHEEKFHIYTRSEIPTEWTYNHPRVGDYLLVAKPGYSFHRNHNSRVIGVHGYDPYTLPDMGAIFYAEGPGIKKNIKLPAFKNTDLYSFICALLGIPAAANDGDLVILGKALMDGN